MHEFDPGWTFGQRRTWVNQVRAIPQNLPASICPIGRQGASRLLGCRRIVAIPFVTLAAGRMPPLPGFAPWLSLISIILNMPGFRRFWRVSLRSVCRFLRAPNLAVPS